MLSLRHQDKKFISIWKGSPYNWPNFQLRLSDLRCYPSAFVNQIRLFFGAPSQAGTCPFNLVGSALWSTHSTESLTYSASSSCSCRANWLVTRAVNSMRKTRSPKGAGYQIMPATSFVFFRSLIWVLRSFFCSFFVISQVLGLKDEG